MKWQPIETAPKDGTYIIGWDGEMATTYQWRQASAYPNGGYWSAFGDVESFFGTPELWVPLSDPPK